MTQLRLAIAAIGCLAMLALAGSANAAAPFKPHLYSLTDFSTGASDTQAGGHPDVWTDFGFANDGGGEPNYAEVFGRTRRLEIDMPYGLVGDPMAYPKCPVNLFFSESCPPQTYVGYSDIITGHHPAWARAAVTNLEPGPNAPARFGIMVSAGGPLWSFIDVKVH